MPEQNKKLFLSAVTVEFAPHRDLLARDLARPTLDVAVQERFVTGGGSLLEKLDDYIRSCDGVIHLIGKRAGRDDDSLAKPAEVAALLASYPDFAAQLPALAPALANPQPGFTYTQWEAYLAIYHRKPVFIYRPSDNAAPIPGCTHDPAQEKSQHDHYARICARGHDRGQFDNEERLSSAVLRDLVEILPRLESSLNIPPTTLPHTARHLIGRDADLTRLDQLWNNNTKNVVVIRAWGGVGKTALVAAWMAELSAKGWRGAERVYDVSFYSQGTRTAGQTENAASADVFIQRALEHFGDPDPLKGSAHDKGARLAKLVADKRTLLVLDGLEPLQHPPGPMAGQLKDPAVAALIKGLAAKNPGLCVITTRERLTDINQYYARTAEDWELSHLSPEAGAELLTTLGVHGTPQQLVEAAAEVKGHALTLTLIGGFLALAHQGDIRRRDVFKFEEADKAAQGGHAFRLLRAYEDWFAGPTKPLLARFMLRIKRLLGQRAEPAEGEIQLAILRLMGLFDRPADPGCLAALRRPPAIPGLTDDLVTLTQAQWNTAITRLQEIGLVSTQPHETIQVFGYDQQAARTSQLGFGTLGALEEFHSPLQPAPGDLALDAHPLLREHFARRLRDSAPNAWQGAHQRLFDHLCAAVPYWPEGLTGLAPLYQAVAHGCHAGLHQRARADVYRDRILRGAGPGGFYSTKALGAIGADLAAVACFFVPERDPWSTPHPTLTPADQSWLLGQAAFSLRALGRLREALQPMRTGLERYVESSEWKNAAISASNLSGLELTLGDVAAAVRDAEQSVAHADRSADEFQRMGNRTTHADALHQAGDLDRSRARYEEAETLQAAMEPDTPRLYSVQGYQFCDLLLSQTERAAWRAILRPPSTPAPPGQSLQHLLARCAEAEDRASYARAIAQSQNWLLDIALDTLTLARAALYRAALQASASPAPPAPPATGSPLALGLSLADEAVDALRAAGQMDDLPRGLLTRALARSLAGDETGARADLDEAWHIAEPGPMPLFMADVHLHRARLFRDKAELAKAAELIQKHKYGRRQAELEDARAALR